MHHLHISLPATATARKQMRDTLPSIADIDTTEIPDKPTFFATRLHPCRPTIRAIREHPLEICIPAHVFERLRRLTAISPRISGGLPRVHSDDRQSDTTQCLELFVPAAGLRRVTSAFTADQLFE